MLKHSPGQNITFRKARFWLRFHSSSLEQLKDFCVELKTECRSSELTENIFDPPKSISSTLFSFSHFDANWIHPPNLTSHNTTLKFSVLLHRCPDLHGEFKPHLKSYKGGELSWRRKRSVRVKERTSRLILKGLLKETPSTMTRTVSVKSQAPFKVFDGCHSHTHTYKQTLNVKDRLLTCNT